jgi:phosphoesterase RecJ-like protein
LAFTILSAEEIRESGVEEEDLEGMANFLSNIKGVKAVLFLREAKEYGVLRGSFRSLSPNTDISLLARALGGGGHPKAAGFKIEGRLEENEGKWKVI